MSFVVGSFIAWIGTKKKNPSQIFMNEKYYSRIHKIMLRSVADVKNGDTTPEQKCRKKLLFNRIGGLSDATCGYVLHVCLCV